MTEQTLNGVWQCRLLCPPEIANQYTDGKQQLQFAAAVPGCVHTALTAAGLLKDPLPGRNADDCMWIERCEAVYTTDFCAAAAAEGEWCELVFDGLDCYCIIRLNGEVIGTTDNGLIRHSFPCKVKEGENTLELRFLPTTTVAEALIKTKNRAGMGGAFDNDRVYVRRMQCTYGWDWVHRLVTLGPWGSVTLRRYNCAKIEDLYVYTKVVDACGAELGVELSCENPGGGRLFANFELYGPDGNEVWHYRRFLMENPDIQTVSVEHPQLWWPNGYGDQPLYRMHVSLTREDGTVLDEKDTVFGIRTIRIMKLYDKEGSEYYHLCKKLQATPVIGDGDTNTEYMGFILVVNGVKIMCKGANWVPPDPFPGAIEDGRYEALLALCREGNLNMLRIWGGGIYLHEAFYDACDRYGIMVNHDFMMACGTYPYQDEEFKAQLAVEAEQIVRRLRSRACLMWWTGDNENSMAEYEASTAPGIQISRLVTGPIVARLDRQREFLLSSPWGGSHFNSPTRGTTHYTGILHYFMQYVRDTDMRDYLAHYRAAIGRFAPETPALGAPFYASLKRFMSDEEIFGPDDTMWRYHTKNHPAGEYQNFGLHDIMENTGRKIFGDYKSEQDRLYKMQCGGYEWIRVMMEAYRRAKWFAAGNLFWMYNDCWPASGWSMVDYYCLPKPGWYAAKQAAAPIRPMLEEQAGALQMVLCCDGAAKAPCEVLVRRVAFAGGEEVLYHGKAPAGENENILLGTIPLPALGKDEIVVMDVAGQRALYTPYIPADLHLPPAKVTLEVADGRVTVRTDVYAKAICLDGDYVFEDNFFDLLPGEERSLSMKKSYRHQDSAIRLSWLNQSDN